MRVFIKPQNHLKKKNYFKVRRRVLIERLYKDRNSGELLNFYKKNSFMSRVINEKEKIQHLRIISQSYIEPKFISYCPSASIFGVIDYGGTVHPV